MKIGIIGGGTAGWLAAAMAVLPDVYKSKNGERKKFEIVVIDSDEISIIGAGEGSTGLFSEYIDTKLSTLGINTIDFLYETESTLKLGIKFKDWKEKGHQYLSPIQPTTTSMKNIDADLLSFVLSGEYYDSTICGHLMNKGLSSFKKDKKNYLKIHSYHFDAHKVGQYFKKICIKNGVKNIKGTVDSVIKNTENGFIKSVRIKETNEIVDADLWFDCSGFSKVLVKEMNMGWKSYSEYLPVNNAIPYIHNFENDENILPETLAWAMPNGWMWQIPTQERYGCGYVYSDKFTTYDNAVDELIKTTGRKIEPIRNIKFEVGRLEKFWDKNVLAIGLSSNFLEPLQATSIHSTIIQLDYFLYHHLNYDVDRFEYIESSKIYNNFVSKMVDDFRDLIQIHYMGGREDTDFWKYCKYDLKKTDKVKSILEISKYRSPSFLDFEMYHGAGSWGVWCWTLCGLGYINKYNAEKTLSQHSLIKRAQNSFRSISYENQLSSISLMTNKELIKNLISKKIIK
jgi:tryptophan halogenase